MSLLLNLILFSLVIFPIPSKYLVEDKSKILDVLVNYMQHWLDESHWNSA